MKRPNNKIIIGIILILLLIGIRFIGIDKIINLERIQQDRFLLQEWVKHHYALSVGIFIGIYFLVTAVSLPLAALLTITGGFLFGVIYGTLYSNIGATAGATISFLSFRYFLRDWAQKRYANRFKRINQAIERRGGWYLVSLRLVAVMPLVVVNALASVTHIPVTTFIWATALGIIPGSLVYAFAGRQLATIESLHDIFSFPILMAFILLALLALVPALVKSGRKMKKRFK